MALSHVAILLSCFLTSCIPLGKADSDIDIFSKKLTQALLNSKYLGKSAHFTLTDPGGVFKRVSDKLFAKVGGYNGTNLPELVEHVGEVVGTVTSKLYFDTVGHTVAKVLDYAGLVSEDTIIPYTYWILKSIELEACINGFPDPESVVNNVLEGIYDVMEVLGLDSKDNVVELYHVFTQTLPERARDESYEILFDIYGEVKVHSV